MYLRQFAIWLARPAFALRLGAALLAALFGACNRNSLPTEHAAAAVPQPAAALPEPMRTAAPVANRGQRELRVLFVGNSLTEANDLPGLVQAMATEAGVRLHAEAVTQGGFNLEDHWQSGHAQRLADSHWDYVVLQQGPSTLPESQANLREWAGRWAEEARRHHAMPALYMVWPFQGQQNGFTLVSHSYRAAAAAAHARILPAGEAWEQALRLQPAVRLYGEDDLHPSAAGTYLAGLVIVRELAGVPPRQVPAQLTLPSGDHVTLPEKQAEQLRGVVAHLQAKGK